MFASSHSVLILYKMHCIGELFFTLCFAQFVKQPEDRSPVWFRTEIRGGGIVNSLQVGTQFPKQVGLQALPFFQRWLGSITCIYSFSPKVYKRGACLIYRFRFKESKIPRLC